MKKCASCGETKQESEFWRSAKNKDGLHSYCKGCSRRKRVEYIDRDRASHRKKAKARRAQKRSVVRGYLSRNPCVECGEADPIVLDFDHIRGKKEFNVSDGISQDISLERILKEVNKCQILCANCHRKETHRRRLVRRTKEHEL